jgi:transposase
MPSFVRVANGGEAGMLTVETIGRVRREFHVKGKKIKTIARELRVSRNTVRRIVRGDETVHRYARKEQPLPQLGMHVAALEEMLTANAGKSQRERLTFMRMFEELRLSGYAGGYDAVRRYARAWERQQGIRQAEAYVPLSFAPGEAYQFDWSHEVVVLDGVTNVVKVAQIRLCHSRMPFVRAYPREAQEMVFDARRTAS